MKTYLPIISDRCINELLAGLNSSTEAELAKQHYERLGIDRAFMILCDISARYGTPSGWRIVDLGCNTGTISALIAAKGNTVIGVDNFIINVQNIYDNVFQKTFEQRSEELTFVNRDVNAFLEEVQYGYDFILLLSVAHHWETGYDRKTPPLYSNQEMHDIFTRIKLICRKAVYLELPDGESYWPRGYAENFIARFFQGWTHDIVGFTVGPVGTIRWLYCVTPLYQDINLHKNV
jgi:SAM-dependent methyltransferase